MLDKHNEKLGTYDVTGKSLQLASIIELPQNYVIPLRILEPIIQNAYCVELL